MNPFLLNLAATGTASTKQLAYLNSYISRTGLKSFRAYRQQLNIHTPLHRMSKFEASRLIEAIEADRKEAGQ